MLRPTVGRSAATLVSDAEPCKLEVLRFASNIRMPLIGSIVCSCDNIRRQAAPTVPWNP